VTGEETHRRHHPPVPACHHWESKKALSEMGTNKRRRREIIVWTSESISGEPGAKVFWNLRVQIFFSKYLPNLGVTHFLTSIVFLFYYL
jgi:hypothetical protein